MKSIIDLQQRHRSSSLLKRGFTIIELLVVIVVIGILAAIIVTTFNGIRKQAILASMRTDLTGAYTAITNYSTENGFYPSIESATNNGTGLKLSPGNSVTYEKLGTIPTTYILYIQNNSVNERYQIVGPTSNEAVLVTNPNIAVPQLGSEYQTSNCGANFYNTTLISSGTGTPTPTYQWQQMSPKNTTSGTWANISGATTQAYTLSDVTTNTDEYRMYRVIYSSSAAVITSPAVKMVRTNGC